MRLLALLCLPLPGFVLGQTAFTFCKMAAGNLQHTRPSQPGPPQATPHSQHTDRILWIGPAWSIYPSGHPHSQRSGISQLARPAWVTVPPLRSVPPESHGMSLTQEGGAVWLEVEETPGRQKQQLLLAVVVLFLFREGRLGEAKWLVSIIHSFIHSVIIS